MTYDASTPWRGSGVATPPLIDTWFKSRNPKAPAGLGQAIWTEALAASLNQDLVAAQVDEETGSWTSAIALDKLNPAGIGAVDNNAYAGALTFATIQAGIHAQCAHLLSYVLGTANPLKADDPRYSAMPMAWLGTKTTLGDFGAGVWASDPDYAAKLAAHANDLLAYAAAHPDNQGSSPTVSVTDFYGVPLAWMPADPSNYQSGRSGKPVLWFVVHDEEASTAMSAVNRFQQAGQQASSHFVTDPANNRIIQCVGTVDTAYTVGNLDVNQKSISTENPGFAGQPYPDAIVDYCARVGAYCAKKYNIPVVRVTRAQINAGVPGFCGHQDVPDPSNPNLGGGSDHHNDPGPTWPWDKFLALVRQYAGQGSVQPQNVNPPKPVQPAYQERQFFPETGHSVSGGFKRFRDKLESEEPGIVGAPVSEEFTDEKDGYRKQAFERCVMEWQGPGKGGWPHNDWDVFLARVGAGDPTVADFRQRHPEAFAPVQQ